MKLGARAGIAGLIVIAMGCSAKDAGTGGDAGTTGGAACGKVQPCGGELQGTWAITAFCVSDPARSGIDPAALCELATASLAGSTISGTATFGPDGTYQVDERLTLSMNIELPATCFPNGAMCDQVAASLAPPGDAQIASATCVDAGSGCSCTIIGTPQAITESGTAVTSGTTLTSMPDGQAAASSTPYCIVGDELHIITVDMPMPLGPMGTVNVSGDLVATRS